MKFQLKCINSENWCILIEISLKFVLIDENALDNDICNMAAIFLPLNTLIASP